MITFRERTSLFAPLGIRFMDAATDRPVRGGLAVRAWPLDGGASPVAAIRTVSGAYAFVSLPGVTVAALEDAGSPPLGGSPFDGSPPEPQPFVIEVRDRLGRFVPVVFVEDLPLPERGLYPGPMPAGSPPGPVGSPPGGEPGFYLFSAPARPVPPGLAVVRAHLVDAGAGGPAAFAVLEVDAQGATWYGLADEAGQVALLFPYPAITTTLVGSPPAGMTPLHAQQWPLAVRVRYAPAQQQPLAARRQEPPAWPELRSLFAQPPALIHPARPASPPSLLPVETVAATLRYGEACVLRTGQAPTLWIQESLSSP